MLILTIEHNFSNKLDVTELFVITLFNSVNLMKEIKILDQNAFKAFLLYGNVIKHV